MNCGNQEVLSSVYITRNSDNVEDFKKRPLAEHWQIQELVMMEKL